MLQLRDRGSLLFYHYHDLAEMFLLPLRLSSAFGSSRPTEECRSHLVLISIFALFQAEDFLVNYQMNIICFYRFIHLLKLLPAAYTDASYNTALHSKLGFGRQTRPLTLEIANNCNQTPSLKAFRA
jgi:hypothetical protein